MNKNYQVFNTGFTDADLCNLAQRIKNNQFSKHEVIKFKQFIKALNGVLVDMRPHFHLCDKVDIGANFKFMDLLAQRIKKINKKVVDMVQWMPSFINHFAAFAELQKVEQVNEHDIERFTRQVNLLMIASCVHAMVDTARIDQEKSFVQALKLGQILYAIGKHVRDEAA